MTRDAARTLDRGSGASRLAVTALTLLIFLFSSIGSTVAQGESAPPRVGVGIVLDGPWERNLELVELFQFELIELLEGEFDVVFPAESLFTGAHEITSVEGSLDALFSDPSIDVVLALGPLASHAAARRGALPKPTFAPFVINRFVQGLPIDGGTSGVSNLNYLDLYSNPQRNIEAMREVAPFESLSLLVAASIVEALPDLGSNVARELAAIDVPFNVVPVGDSVEEALAAIPDDAGAAYVTPLLTLPEGGLDRLAEGLIARKLPSYSVWGRAEVERGLLFTMTSEDHLPRLARRIALNVQRVLLGENASTLPYLFPRNENRLINMETARAIGVFPRWEILTEAELLNAEPESLSDPISLAEAAREAVRSNLDLRALARGVRAGAEQIEIARGALRPQIDAFASETFIDDDRAEASFGSQAESTFRVGASAEQVVLSDRAFANKTIQKALQDSRVAELRTLELDVGLGAATAYLNVLRARTFERIRRENLRRTRSNLDLAEVREEVGSAGRSEVYRWESEVAQARIDVQEAEADRRVAEIELARIMNRPLDEKINTIEADVDDPELVTSEEQLDPFVSNPYKFSIFGRFMVDEALQRAPELRTIDAAIEAERRALLSARRAFWMPEGVLSAEWSARSFAGAGSDLEPISSTFPLPDDQDWSVALGFSLPLYAGGTRRAELRQRDESLAQLTGERDSIAQRVTQRVLSALEFAGASNATIRLSRDAAEAARKNLELVTDAYTRGALDVLDLLDAQNESLIAELRASNAKYAFLIDVFDVERATGEINVLRTPAEREAWFYRLIAFFEENDPTFDAAPFAPPAEDEGPR